MRFLITLFTILVFLPVVVIGFLLAMIVGAYQTGWRGAKAFQSWALSDHEHDRFL